MLNLRTYSDHSLLYGYGTINEYVKKAKENNIKALGLTDKHTASGLYKFVKECQKNDIIPIPGIELNIENEFIPFINTTITLFAFNNKGLQNIYKILRKSYEREDYKNPKTNLKDIEEHKEGIFIVIGYDTNELSLLLESQQKTKAKQYLKKVYSIFKENLFIGIDRNIPQIVDIVNKLGIKALPFKPTFYPNKEDYDMAEKVMAIGSYSKMKETPKYKGGKRPTPGKKEDNFYLMTENELKDYFYYFNSFEDITSKVNVYFNFNSDLKPKFILPENEESNIEYLKKLIIEGLKKKRKDKELQKISKERIKTEIDTILGNDFADYFLVVQDYCKYAEKYCGGIGLGRGSVAGSEIAYLLDIHNTDPLKYNLLFERFLSSGRGSEYTITFEDDTEEKSIISNKHKIDKKTLYTYQLKIGDIINEKKIKKIEITRLSASSVDVDTDFHTIGREKVLDYIKDKYGEEKVCNIITFGTFKTKKAIKDLCTIYDIPFKKANELSNLIPEDYNFEEFSTDKEVKGDFNRFLEMIEEMGVRDVFLDSVSRLEGRIRNEGVHACGILLSSIALDESVPTQRNIKNGAWMSQWEYADCEAIGLIKMDFLGLDTVDLIEYTLKLIKEQQGIILTKDDIINKFLNDTETYENIFSKGKTDIIFQFSSDGVKKFIRDLKPDNIDDLMAVTALYRPGPMGMDAHNSYVRRKNNPEERIPLDNKKFIGTFVEDILKDTFGLITYQETLMNLAREGADFTPYETDLLRKATAKKKADLLADLKPKFLNNLKEKLKRIHPDKFEGKNPITDEDFTNLWHNIESFAEYSFNKSHSASYVLDAFCSAYLKEHYPIEFMTAALKQADKPNKFKKYMAEAIRMEIPIYPPSINDSDILISIKRDERGKRGIYIGLSSLKSVSIDTATAIIKEREIFPFVDIKDFLKRGIEKKFINKTVFEILADAGAFDCLRVSRKSTKENYTNLVKEIKNQEKNKAKTKGLALGNIKKEKIDLTIEYPKIEKILRQRKLIGFICGKNPLEDTIENGNYDFKDDFYKSIHIPINETIEDILEKGKIYTSTYRIGMIVDIKDKSTKYGKMTLVTIDTHNEILNELILPKHLAEKELKEGNFYLFNFSVHNSKLKIKDIKTIIANKNKVFKIL